MLLRPASREEHRHAGFEVYMLRRKPSMAFAPGAYVFPGGSVDQRDADEEVAWAGPGVDHWGWVFDAPAELARALVCAAVRETFEEAGVLLAGPSPDTVVSDTAPYAHARQQLVDREISFAELLGAAGLGLRTDLLRPWANWVTPKPERRRFDTRFFLATVPDGQRADGATSEATDAGWYRPGVALDEWQAGTRGMLPPTWTTLAELEDLGSVPAAMAAERTIAKLMPSIVRDNGVLRLVVGGERVKSR